MNHQRGITLVELMVVVVIIGILAAVSIPHYRKGLERGYLREAEDALLTVYHGERAYFFENNEYLAVPAGALMGTWREIYVDNPNLGSIPTTFSVTNVVNGPEVYTFIARAARDNGPCGGLQLTVNQDRLIGGAWLDCGAL